MYTSTGLYFQIFTIFSSGDMHFDITAFFEPYVRQWLVNTDSKTEQWVQAVGVSLVLLFLCLTFPS